MADLTHESRVETARLKHYAAKIRKEAPDLPSDATDSDILQARYRMEKNQAPDLTPDTYLDGLDEQYGGDFTPPSAPSFISDLGGQIADTVKQIVIHPAETAQALVPYLPSLAAGIAKVSGVPAQIGLAAHFGVKMAGAAIAGHKLESTLANLPALSPQKINEIDLMLQAKGTETEQRKYLISRYIQNVMRGYSDTAQSLASDIGQTATEGRSAGAELGAAQLAHLAGVGGAKIPGGPITKGVAGAVAGGSAFMGGQSAIEGRSPRQVALDALTGGVIAAPLGVVAGAVGGGLKGPATLKAAPPIEPPPVLPEKVPIVEPLGFGERILGPSAETAKLATVGLGEAIRELPRPSAAPFRPTSRAEQVPEYTKVVKRIEASPEYKALLNTSGGGRRVTNIETWKRAIEAPPMSIEEIGNWRPGAPVNEIDIARARILRQVSLEEHKSALVSMDPLKIEEATRKLIAVESGFNNLSATPGRALQMEAAEIPTGGAIEATVQYNKAYVEKVAELQKLKIPADQWAAQLERLKAEHSIAETKVGPLRVAMDGVEAWATAAKLMSPMTHAINTISNGLTYTLQRGPERMLTSAILKTTGRVAEAEGVARNTLWSSSQGVVDATKLAMDEAVRRYRGELPASLPEFVMKDLSKAEVNTTKLPLRADRVFKALDGADTYWKTLTYHAEINQRALTQALSEGVSKTDLPARVKFIMENPPEAWQKEAWTKAKEMTFQENPDKFLKSLQGIQRLPGGRIFFAAFLKTPYNIIKYAYRRSPLALAELPFDTSRLRKRLVGSPLERAEALAEIGWGTALQVGLTGLAFRTETTAAYPKGNVKEIKRWEENRMTPWSMKVGDRWYNFSRFGPLSISMMMAAGYKQAMLEGRKEDAGNFAGRLAGQFLRGPLELPMMQSTADLIAALEDPENKFDKYIQTVSTGFVPNILRDVRQQIDDTRRKPKGWMQAMADMLPGLSQNVPAKIDALGRESKLDPNRFARMTKLTSKSTSDEVTRAIEEADYQPPIPNTTLTIGGVRKVLEGEEKTRFLKAMGSAAEEGIRLVMKHPSYPNMSPKQKESAFTRIVRRFQKVAAARYRRGDPPAPAARGDTTLENFLNDLDAMGGSVSQREDALLQEELTRDEGFRLSPYRDSRGNWTVGVGHLVTGPEEMKTLMPEEAKVLLTKDLAEAERRLSRFFDQDVLAKMSRPRKRALINLSFNLGNNLGEFTHFITAINSENWEQAAGALAGTDWEKQVGDRAPRIRRMIQTGREE
jgi:lysozyme